MAKEMGKSECTCSIWKLTAGVALLAVGILAFINGLKLQWNNPLLGALNWNPAVFWYFGGLLLASFGKILKNQSYACCPAHGMCCK